MRSKDQDTIFIRYIGTFGSRSTAIERYEDDIRLRQRDADVLAAFLHALDTMMPDVLETMSIFVLPTATLHPVSVDGGVSKSLVDERERLLIALFGMSKLLNRQVGGFLPTYEPHAEDAELFATLNTRVLTSGLTQLQAPPSDIKKGLSDLMDDIFKYLDDSLGAKKKSKVVLASNLPQLAKRSRAKPAPGLKQLLLTQATPSLINKHVLLAVIGKDITLEDYLKPRPFLKEEGSRAGHLLF